MEAVLTTSKWTQKAQVLAGTLTIAIAINLILLLLIASLVNCKQTERELLPQLRPVDFIRLPTPKPPEPKPEPPPPEEKIAEKPVEPPKEEIKPPPKKVVKQVKKPSPKTPTKVAAPKLDIPLDGTGSAFESVAGKDSRLTAPPTKWDVKQEPEPPKMAPVTRRLIAVSRVMPVYPWRAKAMGVEGWVKVEIIVDTGGNVSRVTVVDDKPKDMFGQAAITAIKKWRFKPAFVDGQAVEQRAVQIMEFRLRN